MVGMVVVSHSEHLAEGVVEIAKMMAEEVPIAAAGGLEDGSQGTSFKKIADAVQKVYSPDGVAILIDIGSALFTAEMVIEEMDLKNVEILDCPLVEGAIVAAVASRSGNSLKEIVEKVSESRKYRKIEV